MRSGTGVAAGVGAGAVARGLVAAGVGDVPAEGFGVEAHPARQASAAARARRLTSSPPPHDGGLEVGVHGDHHAASLRRYWLAAARERRRVDRAVHGQIPRQVAGIAALECCRPAAARRGRQPLEAAQLTDSIWFLARSSSSSSTGFARRASSSSSITATSRPGCGRPAATPRSRTRSGGLALLRRGHALGDLQLVHEAPVEPRRLTTAQDLGEQVHLAVPRGEAGAGEEIERPAAAAPWPRSRRAWSRSSRAAGTGRRDVGGRRPGWGRSTSRPAPWSRRGRCRRR